LFWKRKSTARTWACPSAGQGHYSLQALESLVISGMSAYRNGPFSANNPADHQWRKPNGKESSDTERLDVYNGLLLDAAFDRGLITVDLEGKAIVSPLLKPNALAVLDLNSKSNISIRPQHKCYLTWHINNVFKSVAC
jgi:hypothetical protein